jgi:UDP-2-acetamido-2,6-beta-L-arabino-hexul-4-ose reductase
MNILITGAKGFIGKNLIAQLNNIKEGKAKEERISSDLTVFAYDIDTIPVYWTNIVGKPISFFTWRE